jgi:hypothetical protein
MNKPHNTVPRTVPTQSHGEWIGQRTRRQTRTGSYEGTTGMPVDEDWDTNEDQEDQEDGIPNDEDEEGKEVAE